MNRAHLLAAAIAACALPVPVRAADASLGLPALRAPAPAQAALGRQLFFDRRLSANGTLSCAMCHVPAQGFTVNEVRTSVGINGVSLRRNAPTLLNVGHVRRLFVDGRSVSLEAQALQPLVHPEEMANPTLAAVMIRIDALPDYRAALRAAFGHGRATPARVAAALAAYERTLIAADSAFDRWYYGGRADAIGATEQRGFALFQLHGCVQCHAIGPTHALFSDGAFHNTGAQARSDAQRQQPIAVALAPGKSTWVTPQALRRIGLVARDDLGRHEVTRRTVDLRAFRTPSLRNVALTGPYMHDGSFDTLDAVVDYYARGGTPSDPAQDPRIHPLPLTASDRTALVAFLRSLTSSALTPGDADPASPPIGQAGR